MKEVTAFEDRSGRLHKTKRECIEATFTYMMQEAWGKMPDQRDRGDPVVLARILAAPHYASSRAALVGALDWLDTALAGSK